MKRSEVKPPATRRSKRTKKGRVEEEANTEDVDPHAHLKENVPPRPEVYTVKPPQPKEKKPGQLTEEQLNHFFEKGYVVVKDYFDKKLLDDAREAVNDLVDKLANILFATGLIKNKYEDKGFFDRLIYINKEYPGSSVVMHKLGILPDAFKRIWSNENLLNVVEQMIGPDIAGHPVWNLRTKTPNNPHATVPWHQDNAYLEPCSQNVLQPTAWIPLVDATKKTGCMEMVAYGHQKGITADHTCCAGGTWYVELSEEEMEKTLGIDLEKSREICEVPYGGVLFLNNTVPHRSLENYSDITRWSLDLRWQRPDFPNGFHGIADSVLMRTTKDPDYKVDWTKIEGARITDTSSLSPDDDFLQPIIVGPWMHRWERTHDNHHTAALSLIHI